MTALWNPAWSALHAYSLTAVVVPTTFAGYQWYCTTAGTSGAVEPTWPDPTITPTIVDGTVTWAAATALRMAAQAGLLALVQAFAAANPTIVRSVRTNRPPSYVNAELPCFYIADIGETETYTPGLWQRTLSGMTAVLVDAMGSVDESNDRMNFAHDALATLFTLNYHAISGRSIFQFQSVDDGEVQEAGAAFPTLVFNFGATTGQEGRT